MKTLWEKEKLLAPFPTVYSTHLENFFSIFIKYEIVVYKLFQFESVYNLSFEKELKNYNNNNNNNNNDTTTTNDNNNNNNNNNNNDFILRR